MIYQVRIISDKKIKGFEPYDDNEFIKEKTIKAKNMDELFFKLYKKYKFSKNNITGSDIDINYACFNLEQKGVNYTFDIEET